jgi:hypothetical protein
VGGSRRVARLLHRHRTDQWFLTYDHDKRVPDLYCGLRHTNFNIAHTAARQHVGQEYAVFSDGLAIGSLDGLSTPWAVS